MNIFQSIKWRLQLWYGLILVLVLAGFGFTAYQLERVRQFRKLDEELHRRVSVIANAMHRQGPRNGNLPGPPEDQPPGGPEADGPPFGPPPRGQFPADDPRGQNRPPFAHFELSPEDARLFDATDPNGFYFVALTRDGAELARSTNAPKNVKFPAPVSPAGDRSRPVVAGRYPEAEGPPADVAVEKIPGGSVSAGAMRGSAREVTVQTPLGGIIVVGRNIAPELKELLWVAWTLTCVGGVILLFGLAGGAWLVSRALKPISEISATAVKISAGDLSQRINAAETESELGQLASVLNATFARLETAFAQQKQFASDAAHELRTPVSVILTQTQTSLARERDAASYKQTVEACQRAAQRMRRLIESLLELARFDAGQEVLKRMRFDFSKTISESADWVQTLADERGVKIISELDPLEITGDPERLAQVVMNLLTNAVQYNQPGGEVRALLKSENGLAILQVADTGQGIAPEDLPRVFERFYRADAARTGSGHAGLGLSICKVIVEAHGGTMEVSSERNRGTTFTVRLPMA